MEIKPSAMSSDVDELSLDEMADVVIELRGIIRDGKAQWDKLALIIDVDPDNADAMIARARTLMAGIGSVVDASAIASAREEFPVLAAMHDTIDAAILHEQARRQRLEADLSAMTVDEFINRRRKTLGAAIPSGLTFPKKEVNFIKSWLHKFVGRSR